MTSDPPEEMKTTEELPTYNPPYKPPFPWFGGKSRVAHIVWERFGNVPNYVEPSFGSGAVLFNRPHPPKIETVNDLDAYVANFFRAIQHDPEGVATHANTPVNEADLHARHLWLLGRQDFRTRMFEDPDFYDVKIAGWWVWGCNLWIGSGWCSSNCYYDGYTTPRTSIHRPSTQRPHLDSRKRRRRPSTKLNNHKSGIYDYLAALSSRLKYVRVCCGEWYRILGPSPTTKLGITGVFLDPPYDDELRQENIYAIDSMHVAKDVQQWAIDNGNNPLLRIALCGYDSVIMPESWTKIQWKAQGGYGSQGNSSGRRNAYREVVWFSPHCLLPTQPLLF